MAISLAFDGTSQKRKRNVQARRKKGTPIALFSAPF